MPLENPGKRDSFQISMRSTCSDSSCHRPAVNQLYRSRSCASKIRFSFISDFSRRRCRTKCSKFFSSLVLWVAFRSGVLPVRFQQPVQPKYSDRRCSLRCSAVTSPVCSFEFAKLFISLIDFQNLPKFDFRLQSSRVLRIAVSFEIRMLSPRNSEVFHHSRRFTCGE